MKLFTIIMNITLLPSLFKAGALTALACGTLALTSVSLSSCGGGGSETDNTPDAQLATELIGHELAFDSQPTLLTIRLTSRTRGTGRCTGTAQWSNSYPNSVITLQNTSKQGGLWHSRLSLTVDSINSLSGDANFLAFYGISSGLSNVVVTPMAFDIVIPEDFRRTAQGTYKRLEATYTHNDSTDPLTINEDNGTLTIDPSN
ncbi:MAG: hypothetical protein ACI4OS_00485 [Akkermansia sp.]